MITFAPHGGTHDHFETFLIRYINVYGCDKWAYTYGRAFSKLAVAKNDNSNCNHPEAQGWMAVLFFISFVVLGAQVLMTLFIGIVSTSMEEAKAHRKAEIMREEANDHRRRLLKIESERVLDSYRKIFSELDTRGEK